MIKEIECCAECPFEIKGYEEKSYCLQHKILARIVDLDTILHDCPLKEEPITIKLKQ